MKSSGMSGFTIMELMIAVAIFALLLGVGVPSFNDAMRRNRLAASTNDLMSSLALARSEALKRGQMVSVCGSNAAQTACTGNVDWANGMIAFTDAGVIGLFDGADAILQRWPAASERNLTLISEAASLTYRPDGSLNVPVGVNALNLDLRTEHCVNNHRRIVTVRRTGRAASAVTAC